ncbi:MAG: YitT family protein [Firmicutes bacterium]|nr:YitT family protein [Bacillota bacterium]MDY6161629.1 YitT family protein [Candidatus Faecousia sp.]
MKKIWKKADWIVLTALGSAVFALGFSLFLEPNNINAGGISGLAQAVAHIFGLENVGVLSVILNLPLFFVGGLRVGKRFFAGSLLGTFVSGLLIDAFALISIGPQDTLVSGIYGGVLCGLGIGIVFAAGTSTGGSDILVRLLKLRYRNVPIGIISSAFDACVVILTGIVFRDLSRALFSGIVVFIMGRVMDVVVYRFDYSKVALIVSDQAEEIAKDICDKLDRGATFLHGQGYYSRQEKNVVLTVVKKRQLAELKELVMERDEKAFVIVQEAHQVLGDGFSRYSKDAL